jgi:hypothetical protein
MTEKEKEIYLNIRAEQIKHFHDTRNGHLLKEPYSLDRARAIAENQLTYDLYQGELRLTLDELLLNDNETCIFIAQQRQIEFAKKIYSA